MILQKRQLRIYYSILFLLVNHLAYNQHIGVPTIRVYELDEYSGGGQNYQIAQGSNGIIYVANNLNLLSFDGIKWNTHKILGRSKIRSVFTSKEGRIYVGGQDEIGYFSPNEKGILQYNSLTELIPQGNKNFEDVWKIHSIESAIYFSTEGITFLYQNNKIEVIPSSTQPEFTLCYKEQLITKFLNKPVQRYNGSTWETIPNQPTNLQSNLASIVTLEDEKELWVTESQSILGMKKGVAFPFAESLASDFKQYNINKGIRLSNGNLAIGTNSNGLYIIDDKSGELIQQINVENGLISRTIYDIYEDQNGTIWLAMNNAIVKISWSYPFSFINENLGLPGTGYSALSHNGNLYLGTNNGLFVSDAGFTPIQNFTRIQGINNQVYNIQEIDGVVIIATNDGVFTLQDNKVKLIEGSTGWWGLVKTENPNLLIGGSYNGLGIFSIQNENLRFIKKYENFSESSRVLAFDKNQTLWMTHGYKGIYQFFFSDDYQKIVKTEFYGPESGLPSTYLNNVFTVEDELLFTTEHGIFQFDNTTQSFVRHQYLDTLIGPEVHTRFIQPDSSGNIFIMADDFTGVLKPNKWTGWELHTKRFNGIHQLLNDDLAGISILNKQNLFFAANGGFVHYNNKLDTQTKELQLKIRSIHLINNDSILYGGYSVENPKDDISLSYSDNSIAFTFAALDYQFDDYQYRYRLKGFTSEKWSDWSSSTTKEFTTLSEGEYQFEVEAQDILGNTSNTVAYSFKIKPPVYRNPIAFAGYFLGSFSLIFFGASLYRKKHKKEKKQLIADQKSELLHRDNELTQLKNEKLEAEVSLKKKQLASSTMHLLDKNDVMGKIKSMLNDILHANEKNSTLTKDLKRIVKEIDSNIDKDEAWQQFEIVFDEVHGDFIKTIRNDFSRLTPQDLKLCAYLRMNMTTKEIANLLKISVRGVEIARYRLRKKLELERETNLVDFIMKYGD